VTADQAPLSDAEADRIAEMLAESPLIAPPLPDAATDPTAYVLAVADLREQRVGAVRPERWRAWPAALPGEWTVAGLTRDGPDPHPVATTHGLHSAEAEAEHIAAEANPAHALTEVALWRAVVAAEECFGAAYRPVVAATVAACQAYAGTGGGT
jgi:hypothetical protein